MSDIDDKIKAYEKAGHVLLKDEDGGVDIFAYANGHHNGPQCIKCGYCRCWHCNPNPPKCEGAE